MIIGLEPMSAGAVLFTVISSNDGRDGSKVINSNYLKWI